MHSAIADEFKDNLIKEMTEATGDQVSGEDPFSPKAIFSPMADKAQFDQVMKYVDLAKESGGKIVLGGERHSDKGYFVNPTIIENTEPDSRVVKEEIFGPILSFTTFDDEDKVKELADDTEFGLYASVFTRDISRALKIATKFESGQVAINTPGLYKC